MSSVLRIESFDHVDTVTFAQKWFASSGIIMAGAGTDGSKAFGLQSWHQHAIIQTGGGEICVGFQFFVRVLPGGAKRILDLRDINNNVVAYVTINSSGGLSLHDHNGNAVGTTASGVVPANGFVYIETGINSAGGDFFIDVNEDRKVSGNVSFSGNDINYVYLSSGFNAMESCEVFYDDFYVNGETVALGILKIACLVPIANGSTVQWIPITSTNFDQVDELTPDSDTTRVLANDAVKDLYDVTAVPTGKTVYGVQLNQYLGKTGVCNHAVRNIINAESILTQGSQVCIEAGGYDFHLSEMFSIYPPDGGEWTPERVNSTEFGSRKIADCNC